MTEQTPSTRRKAAPVPGAVTLCRLSGGEAQGLRWLDAVGWDEAGTAQLRVFLASGTPAAAVDPEPRPGCATVTDRREVSGGLMVAATGAPRLALAGGGALDLNPAPAEWGLLGGRNVLFGFRYAETAETVADWLLYHAHRHGAGGALVVNRAPPDDLAATPDHFAARLAARLPADGPPVVLLESPLPLGKPGLGPETHPFLAPDAPGKDRMERPAPDPWRAPLGEALIYEIAKWRFLARARAVLTLDVCDLLAADAPPAFDLCTRASGGVILMAGHRIYPWRVRKDRPEHFGDHICRQFDNRRGIARWGVAPEAAGLDNTWRPLRVSFMRPDAGAAVPFWRAMGLRVPGRRASELAPKTSLIEDPALIALAETAFGHKPVRAPASAPREAPAQASEAGRTAIVTTMKNEGPFILEWLAYHRAIGVDDVLVYTNDCTDGTDALLDVLQARGLVQHRDNPFRALHMPPQHAALQAAEDEELIRRAGWVICMDVDEFINVRLGEGRLADLYAAMGDANMIALTWRLFGNADVAEYEDRFILEQFTLCAPELVRKPHQAWGFKTLFRNIDIYKKLGVHRPKGLRPDLWDRVKWLNGSGRPMPRAMFRNGWRSTTETFGYDWVSLNHYAVRSAESFLVKRDRGRVNHVDRDQGLNYWFRMNHNTTEDRSIQRMIPAARAEFDRLMADPAIAGAHHAAVAAHRARIADLRARPDQAAFYADLTGARMRRLSRMLAHFGASVFNAGPSVIPPDLHERDIGPDFFFTVDHQGDAEH